MGSRRRGKARPRDRAFRAGTAALAGERGTGSSRLTLTSRRAFTMRYKITHGKNSSQRQVSGLRWMAELRLRSSVTKAHVAPVSGGVFRAVGLPLGTAQQVVLLRCRPRGSFGRRASRDRRELRGSTTAV